MEGRLNPHHPPYTTISDRGSIMPSSSSADYIDDDNDDYKTQPTVEDEEGRPRGAPTPFSDDERLRMLGYDVSLGRPLDFWGSAGLALCHNCYVYEFIAYQAVYAYEGPLLFIIGYPFLALLHLCLIGPFAELVSTFPVAGGMATWAWQLARSGIGGERQWGWVTAGFTLAMHLGKTISYLYSTANTLTSIYMAMSGRVDAMGRVTDYQEWREVVFYLALVSFVTILAMSRVARHRYFWMVAGTMNILAVILVYGMIITSAVKIPPRALTLKLMNGNKPMNWGFPSRSKWIYPLSRMIFMGLPLRVTPIDAPIHMAEETKNPSRTVPRVLWLTSIWHYIHVYVTVTLFIVFVVPVAGGLFPSSPVIPMTMLMGLNSSGTWFCTFWATFCTTLQLVASTVITSRFIFALARDKGIPFSKFLVRTDKHKEPWVAMAALLLSLFASVIGVVVKPQKNYTSLLQAFHFYFISIPYAIPLFLYLLSRVDLRLIGRPEFSLGKWSRPLACIAFLWLVLSLIQGCLPLTNFNGAAMFAAGGKVQKVISFLPMVIAGMLVVCLASWLLYGRHNYVGPIRALTIWTTGQDIDPRNVSTSNPRGRAIRRYIEKTTGRPTTSTNDSGSNPTTPPRPTFSSSPHHSASPGKSGTLQRLLGRPSNTRSSANRGISSDWNTDSSPHGRPPVSVLPESAVLPHETAGDYGRGGFSVVPESGLFPETRHGETTVASVAQAESQLLPERPAPSRNGRRMNFRPSAIKVGDQSYPLTQLSPPPRSPPAATPLSPPPRTRNSLQYGSGLPTQMEAAQEESQLEPEPNDSRLSFGDMPALEESQIHPGGSRDSFGVTNPYGSRSRDSLPRDEESFIEPAALAESQLEPRRW